MENTLEYSFHLSAIADDSTRREIIGLLSTYNDSQAGPSDYQAFTIEIRDGAGIIIGGLLAGTSYGWLSINILFVPESLRGCGLGKKMVLLAEEEAVKRGCSAAWLDTFEFQAKSFYERMGYSCFGVLPEFPKGYSRFFMRKSFVDA